MLAPSQNRSEWGALLLLALFGGYVTYAGSKLDYHSEVGPGPGFFPFWIGVGLMALSAYQALAGMLAVGAGPKAHDWPGARRALAAWLIIATAIFLCRWLGFAASFLLLTTVFIVVLESRSIWRAVAIGAGLALAFHLLFVTLLGVSLPTGPWGF
jgi:putative tricarboxylic transport membrane protein